jgi:predicted Zn-dependent protease
MKWFEKTLLVVMAALAVLAVAARAADQKGKKELEEMRSEAEKVCMSMKPFLERQDKVKKIKIEDNPEINAFADSSGNITFYSGMVDFVRDENELAAVCGHEMAHLSGQHIKRSIFTQIVAGVTSEVVGGTAGNIAGSALANKQSRKHEREADQRGLVYMWKAGYDPRVVWKFWQSIQNVYEQGDSALNKYFSTHPVNTERVENFKVLLVRECKTDPSLKYCDEILADQNLLGLFKQFEQR